jgi:hypothetical protein
MDMSQTVAPKSDQLNADDLIGGPRTITITRVTAAQDTPDQPVAMYFEGDNGKPYKPCKTMRRVFITVWGPDAKEYAGRSVTIYRDPDVAFGGMKVGGVRISHMSHMQNDMTFAVTITKAKRAPYTVRRLAVQEAPKAPVTPAVDALTSAAAIELAEAAAAKGAAHFRAWFNTEEGKNCRATKALTSEQMTRLKSVCDAADAKPAEELDPFGLPPLPTQTDAEIEAKLRAEIAARDAEHTMAAE